MGYHVTILRTANGAPIPIPLEEATAAAQSLDGWRFDQQDASFLKERGDDHLILWYQDGELWTKNPETWAMEAMLEFATRLGARVRGDELETYETAERTYQHPDDIPIIRESEAESKAMLARSIRQQRLIWIGIMIGIMGYFVARGRPGAFIIWIGIMGFFVAVRAACFSIGRYFEKR